MEAPANPYHANPHPYRATDNQISETELEAFAGGKHYPPLLLRMLDGKSRLAGFNLWAMLFGVNWYFFRKLYLAGLAALGLELIAPALAVWAFGSLSRMHFNDLWALSVIGCFIVVRVLVGYMANVALALRAVAVIEEVDALNKDNETHLRLIRVAGGVSVPALLFMFVVLSTIKACS